MRPAWNETFMEMAHVLAKRSTCLRLQTASIIVKDNVIISVGYNGSTPGALHCSDHWREVEDDISDREFQFFLKSDDFQEMHHEWSVEHELHGEMNAILFASRSGIPLENSCLYTIYSPCIHCAKSIISCGIKQVYYQQDYHRDTRGVRFLRSRGIRVEQLFLGQ